MVQKESMLRVGKAMSSAPSWRGRTKFPKAPKRMGVMAKKTIRLPCMVKSIVYCSGLRAPSLPERKRPPRTGMGRKG